MGLLRSINQVYYYHDLLDRSYFEGYLHRVEEYVEQKEGNLDRSKSTEWSRAFLSLSALGYDVTNVAGYDFIDKLSSSYSFSLRQGINGPIWEIIALNTGGYELYEDPSEVPEEKAEVIKEKISRTEVILEKEEVTQEEIEVVVEEVQEEIEELNTVLDEPTVDKSSLATMIEYADNLDISNKSLILQDEFNIALSEAVDVLGNEEATTEDVEKALNNLQSSIERIEEESDTETDEEPDIESGDESETESDDESNETKITDEDDGKVNSKSDDKENNQLQRDQEVKQDNNVNQNSLPKTATPIYSLMFIGMMLLVLGFSYFVFQYVVRRKTI